MTRRLAIAALVLLPPPLLAGPRDELLRVAPPDAALVLVVQNARDHAKAVAASPFGQWFPTTRLGKKVLGSAEWKQAAEVTGVLAALGTTPQAVLDDLLGDAVAFAYSPAPPGGRPADERAVILVRPRRPDALVKVVDKLNEVQTASGEVKAVVRREHAGAEFFERQAGGDGDGPEFYCFRGGVFAFSSSLADITAVIDRDKAAPADREPELVARMRKLGVAGAAAAVLVNPRPLDAEVKAKVAAAKPSERRFLARFAEVWAALDAAAVALDLGADLDVSLALRFRPDKVPADLKKWLVEPRVTNPAVRLIPDDALFGLAGHVTAADLIDLVTSLAPTPPGKPGLKEWVTGVVGPIVGRDRLPLVLGSLGPNWAAWAEPPGPGGLLPTPVLAVEVGGAGADQQKAEKALVQAVGFGFQTARVAYNATHPDQIELREEKDPATGLVVTSLVNEKGFPPGFRPSFALTHGHLVLAGSPDAVRRFKPPAAGPAPEKGKVTLGRLSGARTREYLDAHGPALAKFLSGLGAGDEKEIREGLADAAAVLELVESAELTAADLENGVRLGLRVKPAKPLK